jgi:hypothetical protein
LVQSQKRMTNQLRGIHTSEDIVTAAPISCVKHHNVATLAAALLLPSQSCSPYVQTMWHCSGSHGLSGLRLL